MLIVTNLNVGADEQESRGRSHVADAMNPNTHSLENPKQSDNRGDDTKKHQGQYDRRNRK